MVPNGDNSDKYILLSEVANKCTSLAKKWNCITDKGIVENHSLEDELINRALQQQLYLYCFMPIDQNLPGLGKKWFFIWSDYLKNFSSRQNTVICNLFLASSKDRIKHDRNYDSKLRLMEVRKSDLYLNLDELKKLEESNQDFANLVMVEPDLVGEELGNEISDMREELNISKPTDTREETSSTPIIGEPVDFQPSNDASESAFSSTPRSEIVTATDTQPSLASEIVQEGHSMAQAEKPKRTKQPKKKKENAFPRNVNEASEPPLLIKNDREPIPFKTLADLLTRTLSLEDIIGNREKGIPAIIPVGKSTWYAGVKTGRYPKSFEVSEGRVAWRGADIYTLLQQLRMI